MNKIELAYLAGAMDSDGFISMRNQTVNGSTTYSEYVGLGQVTPIVPDILKAAFGGTVNIRNRNEKWRLFHNWIVMNKGAALLAKTLLPYLKIKRRQAEILCELRKSKSLPQKKRRTIKSGRALKTNPEVVQHRKNLYAEIRALNKVGAV